MMRRSAALSLLAICLFILCASSFVLLNKVGSSTPAMQSKSQSTRQSLDQASLDLKKLQKFKLILPPGAPPQAFALQSEQDQQITQLQNEIASLQAQLAENQNKQSSDMLTEIVAVVGALGGLIGSIATLTTALRGPLKA